MSTTLRWIIAVLLALLGIFVGFMAFFGGVVGTDACVKVPPDWVYYVLGAAAVLTAVACIVPGVMLVRRTNGRTIVLFSVGAVLLSCAGYGAYFALLGSNC